MLEIPPQSISASFHHTSVFTQKMSLLKEDMETDIYNESLPPLLHRSKKALVADIFSAVFHKRYVSM